MTLFSFLTVLACAEEEVRHIQKAAHERRIPFKTQVELVTVTNSYRADKNPPSIPQRVGGVSV